MTKFEKFDFIAGHVSDACGNNPKFVAIVHDCDDDYVYANIIWSRLENGSYQNAWFLGDDVQFKITAKKFSSCDSVKNCKYLTFPYDFPGHMVYGHLPYDGPDKYLKMYPDCIIADKQRFKDLQAYLKLNSKSKDDFSKVINEFFDKHNWHWNHFLQGASKDYFKN